MERVEAVYRGMDQEELDRQYDQRTLVPDFAPVFEGWQAASRAAAIRLGQPTRSAYGRSSWQYVDIFPAGRNPMGTHVHYHGGAWKALGSEDAWWLAEPWVEAGYHFVSVNFGLVPQITLKQQVIEAQTALMRLDELLEQAQLPAPQRRLISGHSSGAHLAAMAALSKKGAGKQSCVERVMLASGVYDLEPVQLSARNDYLRLERSSVEALSPIHSLAASLPPVVVLWSPKELPEFQRQSKSFADVLDRRGASVMTVAAEVSTHFDTWGMLLPSIAGD